MNVSADIRPVAVVIDNDPAVRNSLQFYLELDGILVRAYSNATEALEEANYPVCGCLIIDYRLPEMTGLELLALLRGRRMDLPAILITTNPNSDLRGRAKAAGAILVEKPLLTEALNEAVRLALERPCRSQAY